MPEYSRYYAVLETTPDTSWSMLRARYRRLIGQWHPDRFSGDASEQKVAEERSKQITIAYRALEQYYRAHGVLPPLETAAVPEETQPAPPDAAVNFEAAQAPGAGAFDPVEPVRRKGRKRRVLIALSAI